MNILARLEKFYTQHKRGVKGTLCVGLVVTRYALEHGLPIRKKDVVTGGRGQVALLGKAPVQAVLADYGIRQVLAEEGGRTNRGNMGLTIDYLDFLNSGDFSHDQLSSIETWWIDKVKVFLTAKPLPMRLEAGKSLRSAVHNLLAEAEKRQKTSGGAALVGTVLQHLVGAKLSIIVPEGVAMHNASTADAVSDRDGDFVFADVSIHVTTSPSDALMRKCKRNINAGSRPIIITIPSRMISASNHAEDADIGDKVDIFDIEQFIAGNIYELGLFENQRGRETAKAIIDKYNELVSELENNPALSIKLG